MDYYGVSPSSDFFAHYGVKGMKWGVRKAIANKDSKALSKQYSKALKKAKKLNTKASVSKSQQEYKGRMSDAAAAGLTGVVTAGAPLGFRALTRSLNKRVFGIHGLIPFDSETTPYVTTPIGAGLLGLGAYQAGKAIAAKRRTTAKGHAKAVSKAKNWQTEMKSAFKGTKYSQLPGATGQNKAYEYVPMGMTYKNAAKDSVTYPGYSMNKRIANEAKSTNYKKKKSR